MWAPAKDGGCWQWWHTDSFEGFAGEDCEDGSWRVWSWWRWARRVKFVAADFYAEAEEAGVYDDLISGRPAVVAVWQCFAGEDGTGGWLRRRGWECAPGLGGAAGVHEDGATEVGAGGRAWRGPVWPLTSLTISAQ